MAKVLGKGLEALIKNYSDDNQNTQTKIAISDIITNQHQPRTHFDDEKMNMLINSIKEKGIIQPLTVRKNDKKQFELIAGERRLRAAKAAGLKTVPVFIITVNNLAEMMELALIENIQRVDLNPIEEAEGYLVLQEKYNFTQNEIAKSVSKSRSEISNKLRLLKLPKKIMEGLVQNKIFYAHARSLLAIDNKAIMLDIYKQIINNKLNARQTEILVKECQNIVAQKKNKKTYNFLKFEQILQNVLNASVVIKGSSKTKGEIKIKFKNKKEFDSIIKKISR